MADPISVSPLLQSLLDFIVPFILDRYSKTGTGTNGATLADAIRRKFPDRSFEHFGIIKLSEAISIAESKGLLRRDWKAKHLMVFPPGTALPHETRQKSGSPEISFRGGLHIRSDVWRAFVYVGQEAVPFFDRQEGKVVGFANREDAHNGGRHVEIKPIPIASQQQWMGEFLETHKIDSAEAPIHDTYCFTKFPAWLMGHDPSLEREWKRFRVSRVADWIREWSGDHDVPVDQFFETAVPREELTLPESRELDESVLREAIIAAVRELPLEQIAEFAIPVRYLLRAIRGR
jgi:hypothetical protein